MNSFKRLAAILLLVSLLVSCGEQPVEDSSDSSSETTTEVETEKYADNVPELNFGGYEFRTIEQESTKNSFYAEESVGESVSDAIYKRNRATEERFGVTITQTMRQQYSELIKTVTNSVMSQSDEFDLVFGQMFSSAQSAVNGLYVDWNTIPYVDLENPWYTKSIEEASVGSYLPLIESDLCVMYTEQTWLIAYNKTKAAEFKLDDLYSLVNDGKWTIDELNEMITDTYRDLNGDSNRDIDDFYGIGANLDGCQAAAFVYAAGTRLAVVGDDMKITSMIGTEKTIDVLTKLSSLFNENEGSIRKSDNLQTSVHDRTGLFVNEKVMFAPLQVSDLVAEELRSFTSEYGVLPLPKYDEEQEEYYTVVDGGANIMVVPNTTTDKQREIIGALVESMSALSYSDVIPVYCSNALEQKGTRDEESITMLRKILDSRVIDFAYLYDGSSGWVMKLPKMLADSSTIASQIETNRSTVENHYNNIISYLTGNED